MKMKRKTFFNVLVICLFLFVLFNQVLAQSSSLQMGIDFYEKGLCENAVKVLREVISKYPIPPYDAYYYLGLCYYKLKLYNEAIDSFKEAIRIDLTRDKAYVGRGLVYHEIELYPEAIDDFTAFAKDKAQILANCFRGDCAADVLSKADFAVVFGGDGTILSAARDLSESSIPVIGVNVGKLGFLAEFSVDELKELFDRIITDKSLIENRMVLRCKVSRAGKETFSSTAINDVFITAGEPFRMVDLRA